MWCSHINRPPPPASPNRNSGERGAVTKAGGGRWCSSETHLQTPLRLRLGVQPRAPAGVRRLYLLGHLHSEIAPWSPYFLALTPLKTCSVPLDPHRPMMPLDWSEVMHFGQEHPGASCSSGRPRQGARDTHVGIRLGWRLLHFPIGSCHFSLR